MGGDETKCVLTVDVCGDGGGLGENGLGGGREDAAADAREVGGETLGAVRVDATEVGEDEGAGDDGGVGGGDGVGF